ncbi:MAG: class I SAM-dependent methyltransferase [Eubacteriales bacterium]|nr:class I SAM-dependent methyltransferase [Eubacteriales bacterium]MDY3333076.1 class I SAM-dependent methyltransferase [Gallibacter sp.]
MLNNRLLAIANEIEKGQTVADIGTDHGYLPMYLMKENISPKVILADVSKGSLGKAKRNCKEYMPNTKFDFRIGYGIRVLKREEVDVIVIAGMGGVLISEILGKELSKARTFKKIIMQPRTAQGRLRHWLIKKGFAIVNEQLVKEGRFITEVITAIPGQDTESMFIDASPDDIRWEVPYWLLDYNNELLGDFIQGKLDRENRIMTAMQNSTNLTDRDKQVVADNIKYLEDLLKKI